ncbi:acetyltransferase At1g77540-like [Wolffia australiana]
MEAEAIAWNEKAGRFETEDGKAFLQYRLRPINGGGAGVAMDMVHTFVPSSKRGRGTAALLCNAAFQHAKDRSIPVIPTCSYISETFLERNPAWKALVYGGEHAKPSL